jgi:hypothetical protein
VTTASACSTLAAAMRTLRLFASAVSISWSSTGSPNCFHHAVFAVSAAVAGAKRNVAGASTGGRA